MTSLAVLMPIITKAGFMDGLWRGRIRAGTKGFREMAANRLPLCELPELRLAVSGRDDEAVPGDLGSRADESFGLGVTRLMRQVNQKGAARPHGADDLDGF